MTSVCIYYGASIAKFHLVNNPKSKSAQYYRRTPYRALCNYCQIVSPDTYGRRDYLLSVLFRRERSVLISNPTDTTTRKKTKFTPSANE